MPLTRCARYVWCWQQTIDFFSFFFGFAILFIMCGCVFSVGRYSIYSIKLTDYSFEFQGSVHFNSVGHLHHIFINICQHIRCLLQWIKKGKKNFLWCLQANASQLIHMHFNGRGLSFWSQICSFFPSWIA